MFKSIYVEFFSVDGYLLSLLYIFLLSVFLLIILKKMSCTKSESYSVLLSFLFLSLITIISLFEGISPYYPDTFLFSEMISKNIVPQDQSFAVHSFYYMTYPLRMIALFNVATFLILQIFIFEIAMLYLWKSWIIYVKYELNDTKMLNSFSIYVILFTFFPSVLLFITIPLREFIILFGFMIMLYGLMRIKYMKNGFNYFIFGSVVLFFGRPQMIAIIPLLYFLFKVKNIRTLLFYSLLAISLIPVIFTSLTNYSFSPEFFAYLRNHANEKYIASGMTYGIVEWKSYLDILFDLPFLFLQFILSPFPILHNVNPMQMKAILIDSIYVLLIYLLSLICFNKGKMYLIVFFLLGTIFSIWEFYIGGAVRHRLPLVIILFPLASYALHNTIQRVYKK